MDKLSRLLHELIDHAVPQGNKRGELHDLADDIVTTLIDALTPDTPPTAPAPVPAAPKASVPPSA